MQKLVIAVSYMTVHKHFHEYVARAHGEPETADCRSPFSVTGAAQPPAKTVDSWGASRPEVDTVGV